MQGRAARARPDIVVHQLTSLPPAFDPRHMDEQLAENDRLRHEGTANLVAAAAAAGVRRLVAQSTAFAYAPGGSPVKAEDDPLHLDAPQPWRRSVEAVAALEGARAGFAARVGGAPLRLLLRAGNAVRLRWCAARSRPPQALPHRGLGRGGIFSFVHVDDAAAATALALERGTKVLNVVDDEPAPVRTWLPVYAEAIGAARPHRVPALAARAGGGPHAVYLATEQPGASNVLAKRELGWQLRYPSWRDGFRSE